MGIRKWVLGIVVSMSALGASASSALATQVSLQGCPGSGFPYTDQYSFPVAPEGFAADCQYGIGDAFVDVRTGTPTVHINVDQIAVDSRGRLLSFFAPGGGDFNLLHPTGTVVALKDPTAIAFTYDTAGRLTREAGPETTTNVSYDSAGRVTKLTSKDGSFQSFVYSAAGKLTGWSDSGGDTATLTYNAAGRLVNAVSVFTVTDPTDSYTFDAAGNLLTWSNANGAMTNTLTYTHNANRDVTTVKRGSLTDASLTYAAPHKLSAVISGPETISFTYNAAGRLVESSENSGPVNTFAYDQVGRLSSATNSASATTTAFSYDVLGRVTGLKTGTESSTIVYLPVPSALTGGTSALKPTSAMLKGTINPHGAPTTYHFQYGKTKAYGHTTKSIVLTAGSIAVAVKALLHNLKSSTTYHYRLVASNAAGPSNGKDRTFKTKALCHVPNLIGDSLGQAKSALKHAHCKLGKVRKPKHGSHLKVVSQHPSAGSTRPAGSKVSVKLAKS